jgi:hypothetical protein
VFDSPWAHAVTPHLAIRPPSPKSNPIAGAPIKKGAIRHGDRPLGSSLTSRRGWLAAWLRVRPYVAHTATIFVWISSCKLDGRPIQPHPLCTTRVGALHSPSGSLLTPRASCWTRWRSFDRHVPAAAIVPRDIKVSRYRGPRRSPCALPSDGIAATIWV